MNGDQTESPLARALQAATDELGLGVGRSPERRGDLVSDMSRKLREAEAALMQRTQVIKDFEKEFNHLITVMEDLKGVKGGLEAKLSSAEMALGEVRLDTASRVRTEQEARELAESRLRDSEARHLRFVKRDATERSHWELRLKHLEEADKSHREQLRTERGLREEAERKLYVERQGALKRNLQAIISAGIGEPHKAALAEADKRIRQLESDVQTELASRHAAEKKFLGEVAARKHVEGQSSIELASLQKRIALYEEQTLTSSPTTTTTLAPQSPPTDLFTPVAKANEEKLLQYEEKVADLSQETEILSSLLESEKQAHSITRVKLNDALRQVRTKSAMELNDLPPDDNDDNGEDENVSISRSMMREIRSQLLSIAAERDELRELGSGVDLIREALRGIAAAAVNVDSAIEEEEVTGVIMDGQAMQDPALEIERLRKVLSSRTESIGKLKQLLKGKEVVLVKLSEALRVERARAVSFEAAGFDPSRSPSDKPTTTNSAQIEALQRQLEEQASSIAASHHNGDVMVETLRQSKTRIEVLERNAEAASQSVRRAQGELDLEKGLREVYENRVKELEEGVEGTKSAAIISSLEMRLREEIAERETAVRSTAEMRNNLNEVVSELLEAKTQLEALGIKAAPPASNGLPPPSPTKKGSFSFY